MINRGIVRLNLQFLESLLNFPSEHRIVAARQGDGFADVLELLVEGPTLPRVLPDCVTPGVQLITTVTEDIQRLVPQRTYEGKFE